MIFLILIGILLLIVISHIRIELMYKREGEMDEGKLQVKALFGLLRYTVRFPKLDFEGITKGVTVDTKWNTTTTNTTTFTGKANGQINEFTLRKAQEAFIETLEKVQDFYPLVRNFCSKIVCDQFEWKTHVGTGDAAEAGILAGLVWGIKSFMVGLIGSYIRWKKPPDLDVIPDFHQFVLDTYFHSILRFRVWHAIVVMTRLRIQMRKGRERKWQASTQFKA